MTNILTDLSQKIEENNIDYDIGKQIKSDIVKCILHFLQAYYSYISKGWLIIFNTIIKVDEIKEEIDVERWNYMYKINQLNPEQLKQKEAIKELKEKISKLEQVLLDYCHTMLYQGINSAKKAWVI